MLGVGSKLLVEMTISIAQLFASNLHGFRQTVIYRDHLYQFSGWRRFRPGSLDLFDFERAWYEG